MSTARHHAEWLSLVEASGPFLSLEVLLRVFPQGLEAHDSDHMRRLKLAYEEWRDDQLGTRPVPGIHRAWIEFVLTETLELPEEVLSTGQGISGSLQVTTQQGELLKPHWVVGPLPSPLPGGEGENIARPRLLVQGYPMGQGLEKGIQGSRGSQSPATRMMELLRACDVRLGLVTNGEHWLLVHAPKDGATGFIGWYAGLWQEENITLRAFRSLLGVERFFNVPDEETLEAMLAESVNSQQEVTDQLGFQVRKAVEVLVQSIDRIDQDRNRELLAGVSETRLYEAALTVMMRLVFLFFAEERKMIPPQEYELYNTFYSVSALREQLQDQADQQGEEILERKHDAWCRLLATFRAVYGGIDHDDLAIPAYGGSLFAPDRFPFLEGRREGSTWKNTPAQPIRVNNRTVLHLLEALQVLQMSIPGGGGVERRKLSFKHLSVEQIGHVYEGLLDHTAVRATDTILGLEGTKNKEPEVSLVMLEQHWERGEDILIEFLKKETGRSKSALKKRVPKQTDKQDKEDTRTETEQATRSLRTACNNDPALFERVSPWVNLMRLDTFGYPVVIPRGSVYVTHGVDRRQTGTHYTPRSLTEEIVKYTLEPLVYEGVAEGKTQEDWRLKSAAELLKLKVCDMAMGSGAFLVQVCRYLAEKLVDAWSANHPSPSAPPLPTKTIHILPDGSLSTAKPSDHILPTDPDERLAVARRLVADRCLYGVDKNPMAVEMAKLSLWLITLQKNKPFTFLDHALRCGDSLVGVSLEQLRYWNLDTSGTPELFADAIRRDINQVIELRRQIAARSVETVQDQEEKAYLLTQANARANDLRDGCDLLVSSYLNELKKDRQETARQLLLLAYRDGKDVPMELGEQLDISAVRPFHWELEFPEVFVDEGRGGFDAIVGNPPFQGGKKISGALGKPYREFIVEHLARNVKGHADLCAYFFLRAGRLIKPLGDFGLIATNTIAQGDTREVGLDQLTADGYTIPRAVPSRKWPGSANLEVAYVWLRHGPWTGKSTLDEKTVEGITPFLTIPGQAVGNPEQLVKNQGQSFIGSYVLGMGFVLTSEEAQALIENNPKNKDVLFPYLNGQDLNSRPDQSPSRWVINFFDWPLDAEHDDPDKPKGPPYAADYPDCLAIVREKVKPERTRLKPNGDFVLRKPLPQKWWIYADKRPALYGAIANMQRAFAIPRVSKFLTVSPIPTNIVSSEATVVIASDSFGVFALAQSTTHEEWSRAQGSTLETRMRYTPSDCFETFPFPSTIENLDNIGHRYYTHRQTIMTTRQEGLTKTYNHFHDPTCTDTDIRTLRTLHTEMDHAVAAAYGWQDLPLNHGFHETKQGLRYTISDTTRREVLDRLLALNHERYAEEVAQGLHEKKKKSGKRGKGRKGKKVKSEEVKSEGEKGGKGEGENPPENDVQTSLF